jgi:hypothetical protein
MGVQIASKTTPPKVWRDSWRPNLFLHNDAASLDDKKATAAAIKEPGHILLK